MAIYVRTPNEILTEGYNRVLANTPIKKLTPGSTARAFLEIIARDLGDQYSDVAFNVAQTYASKAVAEHLDLIGALVGVYRGENRVPFDDSYTNFKWIIDPATGLTGSSVASNINAWLARNNLSSYYVTNTTFTIPAGITIQPGYTTTEDAVFGANDTSVFVPVVGTKAGSAYNVSPGALTSHDLVTQYQEFTPVASIILCDNLLPITNGKDVESDEEYRYRIINGPLAAEMANATAVRMAALSVPGVADVYVRDFARGAGTLTLFVLGIEPVVSKGVMNAVKAVVEAVAARGIRIDVDRPVFRSVEATVSLTFADGISDEEKTAIKDAVRATVVSTINGIEMGGVLVVNKLISSILDISDYIRDAAVVNMIIGEYNPDTGKAVRRSPVFAVNQTLFWDEKMFTTSGMVTVC